MPHKQQDLHDKKREVQNTSVDYFLPSDAEKQ